MWMTLLEEAVAASNITQVAAKLKLSRPAISQVLSGTYGAKTDRIRDRVLEVYWRIKCPHLGADISTAECSQYSNSAVPTSSPRAMQHWRTCQTCHNKRSEL